MDTITHTLFGLSLYGATRKERFSTPEKRALLFTAVVGSQIPDIDVISVLWDTNGMYQMWHRGITHSLFFVPVWACLLWLICRWKWGIKDRKFLYIGMLAVFIHDTSDIFNAWGTGYFEPLSSTRLTFGVIPIIDIVFWLTMLTGYLLVKWKRYAPSFVFKTVWAVMAVHVLIQSAIGYAVYNSVKSDYEKVTLAADFIPWHFKAFGKTDDRVDIIAANPLNKKRVMSLHSDIDADLQPLFEKNPEAKTLVEWAPFVVVVNDDKILGVFDPRFYRNGESFLFESIEKN